MTKMLRSGTSIVKHRFINHRICSRVETLIIGTFNPETSSNSADFFYSTGRNYLWRILPTAFGEESLEGRAAMAKTEFIREKRIDFIDLIQSVEVDHGREGVRSDVYIDSKVRAWTDVVSAIEGLPSLKRACFTRKTFFKIPEIKSKIEAVSEKLDARAIKFGCIVSPARYYSADKQREWTAFLKSD
jgi:G:T/U-mismatch repair DNA glycosylase